MRPTFCLAFLLACTTASIHAQEKPAQLAHLDSHGDFLFAEGVFRADILNDNTELAFDTVTRIECYKHGRVGQPGAPSLRGWFMQGWVLGFPLLPPRFLITDR
ncbi:MAG TPA: hypothetical protein VNH19_01600 [Candidatus Limnocylindrales bacterium]|nr:hypothetical protein [Candidatus Limnocylindrales bacterium]